MDTLQTLEVPSLDELFAEFDAFVTERPYLTEVTEPQWLQEAVATAIDNYHQMIDIAVNGSEVDEELLFLALDILEVELTDLLKDKSRVQEILDKLCEEA